MQQYFDAHMNHLVFGDTLSNPIPAEESTSPEYARYLYHQQKYSEALTILKQLKDKWGTLACEIMLKKYSNAQDTLFLLKTQIDLETDAQKALEQRTWLLHWSLFLVFNSAKRDQILDLYQSNLYLNCMQYKCPWLLDYLTILIICFRSRKSLRDFAKILAMEEHQSVVTQLVLAIEDFKDLSTVFPQVVEFINQDYFLNPLAFNFVDSIRECVLERYIKIGKVLDFKDFIGLFESADELEAFLKHKEARVEIGQDGIVVDHFFPISLRVIQEKTRVYEQKTITITQALEKLASKKTVTA